MIPSAAAPNPGLDSAPPSPAALPRRAGKRSRWRWRRAGGLLSRAGDWAVVGLLSILVIGGFASRGYATADGMRGFALLLCAAAGAWGIVGWAGGRWASPELRPARWMVALLGSMVLWGGAFLMPLPAEWVVRLSPDWRETLEAFEAAGLARPTRIPMGLAPERGAQSWNLLVGCLLLFGGIATAASRPGPRRAMLLLVAGAAIVEGWLGAIRYGLVPGARASGALYNSNHHATFILMGIPVAAVLLMEWRERLDARRHEQRGKTRGVGWRIPAGPDLFGWGVWSVALVGALAALSRGAAILGGGVLILWTLDEIRRARRTEDDEDSRTPIPTQHEGETHGEKPENGGTFRPRRRAAIRGGGGGSGGGSGSGGGAIVLVAGALVLLIAWAALVEGYFARFEEAHGDQRRRRHLVEATLHGLADTRGMGTGLGATEFMLNRHAQWPTETIAIWSHNDYAQALAELGLPWAVAAAAIVFGLIAAMRRPRRAAGSTRGPSPAPETQRHARHPPKPNAPQGIQATRGPRATRGHAPRLRARRMHGRLSRSALAGVAIALAHALVDFHLRVPMVAFAFLALTATALSLPFGREADEGTKETTTSSGDA